MQRPRIGIVPDISPDGRQLCLSKQYPEAIRFCGGIPFVLPYHPEFREEDFRLVAREIHGLLLTGSEYDVQPELFGQAFKQGCGPVSKARDSQDFHWIQAAMELKIPILAICYGCQVLAVYFGGTLYQDLLLHRPGSLNHKPHTDATQKVHPLQIRDGSYFMELVNHREVWVNSIHHQAVETLPEGFQLDAMAPDGVIEAFSFRELEQHWIVAVQWHPEYIYREETLSRSIFETFILQAKKYGNQRFG